MTDMYISVFSDLNEDEIIKFSKNYGMFYDDIESKTDFNMTNGKLIHKCLDNYEVVIFRFRGKDLDDLSIDESVSLYRFILHISAQKEPEDIPLYR